MAEDLVLDAAIRNWVLVPLSVVMVLIGLLHYFVAWCVLVPLSVVMVLIGVLSYFVARLMRSYQTPDPKVLKERQVLLRARNSKAGAFRARRVYFTNEFDRQILGALVDQWNQHFIVIDKIIPQNWKDQPAARILELCILYLAMAEITAIGTRHQIVINEAVDLAKRFCDGCAPRIFNGCLRTFVKDFSAMDAVWS